MKIQTYLLLPVVFFGAAALPAQVLLNDNFTSGTTGVFGTSGLPGIGVQNAPTSAEWFSQGSGTANPYTYTAGTGISETGASVSDGVSAYFEAPGSYATLSVGSTLTLSVNFNLMSATAGQPADVASQFRLGLFNSGATATNGHQTTVDTGTTTTTTSTYSPKNYSGFYSDFNPNDAGGGTDNSSVMYYRPVGANTNWIGSNTGSTQVGTNQFNAAVLAGWATDTYQAVETIAYTSATTETISFKILDLTAGGTDISAYDITGTSTGLVTSFDGLSVGGGNGNVGFDPFTITGVNVTEVTPIPEPSAYAAILGAATLGFVAYRSRRQRRQLAS